MSQEELFKQAIEAATQVRDIMGPREKKTNNVFVSLSDQKLGELDKAVKKGQGALQGLATLLQDETAIREAFKELSPLDFSLLRDFSESNILITPETEVLANIIAPGRVAVVESLKTVPFGRHPDVLEKSSLFRTLPADAESVEGEESENKNQLKALAQSQLEGDGEGSGAYWPTAQSVGFNFEAESEEKKMSRAETARFNEEKTKKEHIESFSALDRLFEPKKAGSSDKAVKAVAAKKSPVTSTQQSLFTEEQAPRPADATKPAKVKMK